MKGKNVVVAIPEPCAEQWDNMKPYGPGRHCATCNKVVTDFTLMTDSQILDVLRKAGRGQLCGRYHSSQLGRPLQQQAKPSVLHMLAGRAAAVFLLLQSVSSAVFAQQKQKPVATIHEGVKGRAIVHKARLIRGRVIDNETLQPVAGVTIFISDSAMKGVSGNDGRFTITLPDSFAMSHITLHAVQPVYTDGIFRLMEDLTIDTETALQKETDLYRYEIRTLPEHQMKAYRKPVIDDDCCTSGSVHIMTDNEAPARPSLGERIKRIFGEKKE